MFLLIPCNRSTDQIYSFQLFVQDENQVHARYRQLHIKVMEMFKNGTVINEQIYKQLCQEYGVPIPNDSDVQH